MPPEPTVSLPLIGNVLSFDKVFHLKMMDWFKEVGPIFTFRIGPKPTVVVCSYDLMKEMLVKRADEFNNRPDSWLDEKEAGEE